MAIRWDTSTHGKAQATLAGATELRVVDDPSGTPNSKKTTLTVLAAFVKSVLGLASTDISDFSDAVQAAQTPYPAIHDDAIFVFEGDSKTVGPAGTTSFSSFFGDLPQSANVGTIVNVATSGQRLSHIVADYAAQVEPYKPGGASNPTSLDAILSVWIGANEFYNLAIDGYASPAAYVTALEAYWQNAKDDGFRVIAFTIDPRLDHDSGAIETTRQTINNLIRHSQVWDYLVDPEQIFQEYTDTLWWDAPGVHYTEAGNQRLAFELARVVTSGPASTSPWLPRSVRQLLSPITSFVGALLPSANLAAFVTNLGGASAVRTAIGVVPGTDVQTQSALLSSIAASAPAADDIFYASNATTVAKTTSTSYGRSLLAAANAAALRTLAGAVNIAGDTMTGGLTIQTTLGLQSATAGESKTWDAAAAFKLRGSAAGALATIIGDGQSSVFDLVRYSADTTAANLRMKKSRGSWASPGQVLASDQVFQLTGQAMDDLPAGVATFRNVGIARLAAVSNVTSTSAEGRFQLLLTSTGSVTSTEILRAEHATGLSLFGANVIYDTNRLPILRSFTVATLPAAASSTGGFARVSDSLVAPVYNAVAAGAGTTFAVVVSDGTNWRYA